jgi:hypothetical protein
MMVGQSKLGCLYVVRIINIINRNTFTGDWAK